MFVVELENLMTFKGMRPLERLTKQHWESRGEEVIEWEALKRYEPDQALQAYEQMRATIQFLAGNICSVSDRLWLMRVAQEEELGK